METHTHTHSLEISDLRRLSVIYTLILIRTRIEIQICKYICMLKPSTQWPPTTTKIIDIANEIISQLMWQRQKFVTFSVVLSRPLLARQTEHNFIHTFFEIHFILSSFFCFFFFRFAFLFPISIHLWHF